MAFAEEKKRETKEQTSVLNDKSKAVTDPLILLKEKLQILFDQQESKRQNKNRREEFLTSFVKRLLQLQPQTLLKHLFPDLEERNEFSSLWNDSLNKMLPATQKENLRFNAILSALTVPAIPVNVVLGIAQILGFFLPHLIVPILFFSIILGASLAVYFYFKEHDTLKNKKAIELKGFKHNQLAELIYDEMTCRLNQERKLSATLADVKKGISKTRLDTEKDKQEMKAPSIYNSIVVGAATIGTLSNTFFATIGYLVSVWSLGTLAGLLLGPLGFPLIFSIVCVGIYLGYKHYQLEKKEAITAYKIQRQNQSTEERHSFADRITTMSDKKLPKVFSNEHIEIQLAMYRYNDSENHHGIYNTPSLPNKNVQSQEENVVKGIEEFRNLTALAFYQRRSTATRKLDDAVNKYAEAVEDNIDESKSVDTHLDALKTLFGAIGVWLDERGHESLRTRLVYEFYRKVADKIAELQIKKVESKSIIDEQPGSNLNVGEELQVEGQASGSSTNPSPITFSSTTSMANISP